MYVSLVDTFKSTQTVSILLAAVACALADIFLKKATIQGSLGEALRSPWLLLAIGLYVLQAYFFLIAFIAGSKLSIMGTLLTALYTMIVLSGKAVLSSSARARAGDRRRTADQLVVSGTRRESQRRSRICQR
jgi:hypothetical protein